MSKHNRHHPSVAAAPSGPTTGPTPQPTVEKTMEAPTQQEAEKTAPEAPEVTGPTAKQMAAAEEANQARALKLAQQAAEPPPPADVPIADVAARGYDALHEQFRLHNEKNKPKEYVPPPRTERQMTALEAELSAGARAVARAEEQQRVSRPSPPDGNKEGFTTPVYRPGDMVPDPITGKLGAFGPDA